jgi:hypothetical protein
MTTLLLPLAELPPLACGLRSEANSSTSLMSGFMSA